MKDNRGTEIQIGQTVCYNYMGQIALGTVLDIKRTIKNRRASSLFILKDYVHIPVMANTEFLKLRITRI